MTFFSTGSPPRTAYMAAKLSRYGFTECSTLRPATAGVRA